MNTLEQQIKFHSGLTIGTHLVDFKLGEHIRRALVKITPRGVVSYIAKPRDTDMYASWARIKGDKETSLGGVIVWGARQPGVMAEFEGAPIATVDISQTSAALAKAESPK
jgi:hypothetical protein